MGTRTLTVDDARGLRIAVAAGAGRDAIDFDVTEDIYPYDCVHTILTPDQARELVKMLREMLEEAKRAE